MQHCLRHPTFSRFSRTLTCDRQTQGHNIYQAKRSLHSKNCRNLYLRGWVYHCFSNKGRAVYRRAALYVPGNDEGKIKKIPSLNVDCVILDCEDGVALNRKVCI